jgi:hypothetical protein
LGQEDRRKGVYEREHKNYRMMERIEEMGIVEYGMQKCH